MIEASVKTMDEILEGSAAAPTFKTALRELGQGRLSGQIVFGRSNPQVKVLRLAMKLLEKFPEFPFETLEVHGQSGCSDYVGFAIAEPGQARFEFEWDCKWRAEQQGWTDSFGDPDQIRAARMFGYQCFRRLERAS